MTESSFWSPPTPVALLDSPMTPTAMALLCTQSDTSAKPICANDKPFTLAVQAHAMTEIATRVGVFRLDIGLLRPGIAVVANEYINRPRIICGIVVTVAIHHGSVAILTVGTNGERVTIGAQDNALAELVIRLIINPYMVSSRIASTRAPS